MKIKLISIELCMKIIHSVFVNSAITTVYKYYRLQLFATRYYKVCIIEVMKYYNMLCNQSETKQVYHKLLLDDNTYKLILYSKFSKKFVDKAKQIIISWKDCYRRIKRFEDLIVKYSCDLWCEEEFFAFWKFKYRPIIHSEVYRNYYRNYYNK